MLNFIPRRVPLLVIFDQSRFIMNIRVIQDGKDIIAFDYSKKNAILNARYAYYV